MFPLKDISGMIFNVLIKEVDHEYIAHCLELDIVSTSKKLDQVKNDIIDLIITQVDYAFSNENLEFLYHPAPAGVWQEFYTCKKQIEKKINIQSAFSELSHRFVPPWIIARTCISLKQSCYA
jgi:hypothetical protein